MIFLIIKVLNKRSQDKIEVENVVVKTTQTTNVQSSSYNSQNINNLSKTTKNQNQTNKKKLENDSYWGYFINAYKNDKDDKK